MSQKKAASKAEPELSCSIRLDSSLEGLLHGAASLRKQIVSQITDKLTAFLKILGVPAKIAVTIDNLDEAAPGTSRFLDVHINGKPCLYPNVLLQLVHSYVVGTAIDPTMGPKQLGEWLTGLSQNGTAGHKTIGEFLSLTCLEIVSRQPARVLSQEHAVAYAASLPAPAEPDPSISWPPDPTWLYRVLQAVLDLRISIADKKAVTEIVFHDLKTGRSQQDTIEDLVEMLRPNVIEIQLPEDYFRQVVLADASNDRDLFTRLRDDWFTLLGVHYPRFHFVTVENLKSNCCAIKVNHLTTLPYVGLGPEECLTSGTDADLKRLNIEGRSTIHPVYGTPCSIIDSSKQSAVEGAGLATLNQMSYLVTCLAAVLKEHGRCFIDRGYVSSELVKLATSSPKLVEVIRARISFEQITRVLRALVAEEICIRDLPSILESQLDYAYGIADAAAGTNDDDAAITSFVRRGLQCQITYKYARGEEVLSVYQLNREIDEILATPEATIHLDEDKRNQILAAVHAQVDYFLPVHNTPLIVSSGDGRHRLREIVAKQFPHLPVLAYQEIYPHIKFKPVSDYS